MLIARFKSSLFKPIDSAFLVVFRIGFAVIMFWEVIRYWSHDWIRQFYIEPEFYFKYYGFEWVHPWTGDGMYYHVIVMGILAVFIGIGFLYRLSAAVFSRVQLYIFSRPGALPEPFLHGHVDQLSAGDYARQSQLFC